MRELLRAHLSGKVLAKIGGCASYRNPKRLSALPKTLLLMGRTSFPAILINFAFSVINSRRSAAESSTRQQLTVKELRCVIKFRNFAKNLLRAG